MRSLESDHTTKRRALFDAQDEIDKKREQLIGEIEGKMTQDIALQPLFNIRWNVA